MKILVAAVAGLENKDDWLRGFAESANGRTDLKVETFIANGETPGLSLSGNAHGAINAGGRWQQCYDRLYERAAESDVLIIRDGWDVPPDMLSFLPTFNVLWCNDALSGMNESVALRFDAILYGNVAHQFQLREWGCRRMALLTECVAPRSVPARSEEAELWSAQRDVDVVFVGDWNAANQKRLTALSRAFPNGAHLGKGWAQGPIDAEKKAALYRRARIGWNVHDAEGPANQRLLELPAFGVLQVCDNKTGLGQLFKLGDEVIGFDTIPEAINLIRHYLDHEKEREAIARRGYERFWKTYHADAFWDRLIEQMRDWSAGRVARPRRPSPEVRVHDGGLARMTNLTGSLFVRARRKAGAVWRVVRVPSQAPARQERMPVRAVIPPVNEALCLGERPPSYIENKEMGHVNMARKRLEDGAPLDWPNMLALNWAVTSLIGDAVKIVEIGSGTGPFAEYASVVPERQICCVENDDFARSKAIELRSRSNVRYLKTIEATNHQFDLLTSMDVIEHVDDVMGFLSFCRNLAPRAIFTTPNRNVVRQDGDIGPPEYPPHVREFDAGELFFILRMFYARVTLFHTPNVFVPRLEPMNIAMNGTPIVAECLRA